MSKIFADIARIITKHDGHIERFIGDAVSPTYERRIGRPLSIHSGLNTGLAVTGEVDIEKGAHGITGDSVNTAARMQGLAKSGEILVGRETFHPAEVYFNFEARPPCTVKNKAAPLYTYQLLSRKELRTKSTGSASAGRN